MKRITTAASAALAALLVCTLASCGNGPAKKAVQVDETGATVIVLDGDTARISGAGAAANGTDVRIQSGGTYTVRGASSGSRIVVDAEGADVTLVLDGMQALALRIDRAKQATVFAKEGTQNTLTDSESDLSADGADACLYTDCALTLAGGGALTVNSRTADGVACARTLRIADLTLTVDAANDGVRGKENVYVQNADVRVRAGGGSRARIGENVSAKGIKAGKDILIDGGSCTLDCADDAVHADGSITIRSVRLTASTADDAIHASDKVTIQSGEVDVTAHEGIEGTRIFIHGGSIFIHAGDDGINAAHKTDGVTPVFEITGGELTIEMEPGDTDGIDANGDIRINGGTIRITAQNPFDFDGSADLTGGEVYANGERITELTGA